MGSIQMGKVFHNIPEISQCESEQYPENTLNHCVMSGNKITFEGKI